MPAMLGRLGEDSATWCCLAAAGMPPARAARTDSPDAPGSDGFKSAVAASHAGFYRYCAECHQGSERAPPNFLLGDADQVEAKLRHCAPRIYYRLSMWQRGADARAKTPMPPDSAVRRFKFTPAAWRDGGALSGLILSANERLHAEAGGAARRRTAAPKLREPARVPAGRAGGDIAGTAGAGKQAFTNLSRMRAEP